MKLHTSSLLLSLALAVALHSASARSLPAVRVPVNRPFVVPAQWRRFSFDSDSPSEDGTVVARPHAQNPGPAVEPSPGGPNSQTRPDPRPAPKLNTRPRPHALSAGPAMRPPSGSPNAVQGTATASAPLSPNDFPRTQSTDKPRFVLYGDQWVQGSKLGVPDPNKIKGFTHYNAAFWMATSGPADNAMAWTQGSDDERKAIVKSYNEAGIKLMVSAFGATDVPQTSAGLGNATKTANRLADFVIKYQFQGVDVDYEELDSFANGRGVPWLIALTKQLRKRLPAPKYVITHAPLAPWFSRDVYKDGGYSTVHKDVGKLIDFYNVQFYNQGSNAYTNCDGLLWKGPKHYPSSSLFEIHKRGGVELNKLVIGKPAVASDAESGYMSKRDLGKCAKMAADHGWSAGLMWWEYPHFGTYQLGRVRSYGI